MTQRTKGDTVDVSLIFGPVLVRSDPSSRSNQESSVPQRSERFGVGRVRHFSDAMALGGVVPSTECVDGSRDWSCVIPPS